MRQTHPLEIFTHILSWTVIFCSPLLFMNRNIGVDWTGYLRGCIFPSFLCVVFYANYLCLAPKCLIKGDKKTFIIGETILIAGASILLSYIFQLLLPPHPHHDGEGPSRWVFIVRDTIVLIVSGGLGTAIRLSMEWKHSEEARKEAELGRTEAELKNLRNQINPHFLLNTLNNIYALTAFNTERAQNAIQELSKLLRYILYDNQQTYASLRKEAEFLQTYIELMRIRISKDVDIQVNFILSDNSSDMQIAPLIFISLIENAFKHGISPTKPSFIHISLMASNETKDIVCQIKNSHFPKSQKDKSGSGIGLLQVQKRLDLVYPQCYEWQYGPNEEQTVYSSSLIIHTEKKQL